MMCIVTHCLLIIGRDVMTLTVKNVQCHSQAAVGHRSRCDETTFQKMCNVTHKLWVIGNDVMILPLTTHSLPIGHRKRCDKAAFDKNVQCHSLPLGHRRRYDNTLFHKVWNVTHFLLVMEKDVIRLSFTKCAMSLTCCW